MSPGRCTHVRRIPRYSNLRPNHHVHLPNLLHAFEPSSFREKHPTDVRYRYEWAPERYVVARYLSTRTYAHRPLPDVENRVAGGLKGTLSNPNTSQAAKEHASERLEESAHHKNHVMGGYKATLNSAFSQYMLLTTKNPMKATDPRTSEDAKKHAREILEAAGIQFDAVEDVAAAEHEKRVIAGYKAALNSECDYPVATMAVHDVWA
ncbi:hypothetical protein TRAPUB_12818 [Trametes pubescens]|uniref:Uncharacterized protein n=1 Tax=Trametes pubescens TaxID=154538 RepID=A0A1M2VT25_TRAPU|nr:hypothetical protein TRAPUB_12818 [Trametes pubescens]